MSDIRQRDESTALLARLLRGASIEVPPQDASAPDKLAPWAGPETDVYIAAIPGMGYGRIVEAAVSLRRRGVNPVPHIAACNIASRAELTDFLSRLSGEAGCDRALFIAGDVVRESGPYPSTQALLETGLVQKHGIRAVGLAGHPEGHHTIHQFELWNALNGKLGLVRDAGLNPWIVTQFCFEAPPVLEWLKELRRSGVDVPVRVGIAGPASPATLLTYAVRCGVGNSLRVLMNRPATTRRLLANHTPDDLIRDLAAGLAGFDAGEVGIHIFPFGGIAKAVRWLGQAVPAAAGPAVSVSGGIPDR